MRKTVRCCVSRVTAESQENKNIAIDDVPFCKQKGIYQNLLTQILFDFGEFKGFALKNPTRGVAP